MVVLIGERDEQTRAQIHQALRRTRVKIVSSHAELPPLADMMAKIAPDLIILGDDLDAGVFDFIRDIRHNKVGANPFMLITTLVASTRVDAAKSALQSGTDDVIVRPLKED